MKCGLGRRSRLQILIVIGSCHKRSKMRYMKIFIRDISKILINVHQRMSIIRPPWFTLQKLHLHRF